MSKTETDNETRSEIEIGIEIEWETPRPASRRPTATSVPAGLVEALVSHPGEWAVFKRGVRSSSHQVAQKSLRRCHPDLEFEFTWRSEMDGRRKSLGTAYIRYVGPTKTKPEGTL